VPLNGGTHKIKIIFFTVCGFRGERVELGERAGLVGRVSGGVRAREKGWLGLGGKGRVRGAKG